MSNEYDVLVRREARARMLDKSVIGAKMQLLWDKMATHGADDQDVSAEYPQRILGDLRALYPGQQRPDDHITPSQWETLKCLTSKRPTPR